MGPASAFRKAALGLGLGALLLLAAWLASFVPNADWSGTYDAAARGFLHGHSPYEQPLFVNPPWAVLVLAPFALFPPNLARGLILVCSLASLIYVAWRLRAPWLAMAAVLLSPTAVASLLAANLDALVLLGMFLLPTWGLFVLLIKPQIGLGVAIYHLVETWRTSQFVGVLRAFAPILLASVVAAFLFPAWIDRMVHKPANVWNRSLFPYGVPIGLFFLWLSLRTRNAYFALASTPFFAPYLTFPTYLVVQMSLLHEDVEKIVRRDVLQVGLSGLLWILMLTFRL